ncbi:MAG TPA: DNA primase [Roseiflexaceae bacterium]|jgi:DNA primase|nr:DNA primase [Roseiflexaceae bacterium]
MNSVTDTIKERIDIVEFISAYMPLRKAGRNFLGFCPFHTNTRTPAFTVFPDTQSYHCFGCKASGTVFDFLMQREGLEFREALERLAQRAGVQLQERTEEDEQQDQLRTRLLDINMAAAVFFHHMLVKSPRGAPARDYVATRRIDDETVEAFQLGYAPDDWSMLLSYLTDRKGFDEEEIEAAGLIIHHERRGYYDRFRDRLMFPIRNVKGEIISFGGRAFGDAQPKYMNGPQTPLFDKSRVLYGLDLARDAIRSSDAAVIVEGYVDVIIAHQYGFRNVVAPLGTALTTEHVGAIKKLTRRIFLALDADAAGVRATLKALDTIREHEADDSATPTPQGMLRMEREHDTEIRIIVMPEGRDPDEVIQENPERWRALLAIAQPVMDFYITARTADLDLGSGKGKAEAVARLAPLVAQIANPVEQAHHIQQIARLVQVEEHVIRAALPSQRQVARAQKHKPVVALDTQKTSYSHEDFLLGWLLRYPSARTAVQEKITRDLAAFPVLRDIIGGTLHELFERVSNRMIWQAWERQPEGTNVEDWVKGLDDELRGHAEDILRIELPEPQSYRYVNDTLECATILQQRFAHRWLARTRQQLSDADEADQITALERLVQLQGYIDAISAPKRSSAYADLYSVRSL